MSSAQAWVDKLLPLVFPFSPPKGGYRVIAQYAHTRERFLLRSSLVAAMRTVTVTMSPIFRDLIKELMAGHGNLDVVGELDTRDALEEKLRILAPDLILIGLGRNEGDEIGLSLVRLLPDAKVIAFSSDGRHAFVHRMQPQRTALLDVSPQILIDTILGLR